jgi:hypothetical protein
MIELESRALMTHWEKNVGLDANSPYNRPVIGSFNTNENFADQWMWCQSTRRVCTGVLNRADPQTCKIALLLLLNPSDWILASQLCRIILLLNVIIPELYYIFQVFVQKVENRVASLHHTHCCLRTPVSQA